MRGVALLAVLSACGGSSPARPDAPPIDSTVEPDVAPVDAAIDAAPDASPDAPVDAAIDAPPEVLVQARITIETDGQVRASQRILINRRDGSLYGEGTTGSTGVFDAMMPDGGSLTWVQTDDVVPHFHTYMELHAGDVVNAGTPPPPPSMATPVSITRAPIPGASTMNYGVGRFPDQMFTGTTVSYPATASGTVPVIQDGVGTQGVSVGYSHTTVTVAPGAAVTMPSTIYQANDLVVDVTAPVLQGGLITATAVPFELEASSQSRQEAATASGSVSILFPRFMFARVPYRSALSIYFETIGAPLYEAHFTHYTIDSSVTHVTYGVADLAHCPRAVVNNGGNVTIGQPPVTGDFVRYSIVYWLVTVPHTTTSFARITVPADLAAAFANNSSGLSMLTVDSGDITYRQALALQRSTHYSRYAYTGDGHPYMRECWRNQ